MKLLSQISIRKTIYLSMALSLCIGLSLPSSNAKEKSETEMVSLFNGKNFDNWEKKGGVAKYRIENGEVVGTCQKGTPNTFLCTKKHYGNFILELDYKVDSRMNSGIQIRSNSYDEPKEYKWKTDDGKEKSRTVPAKRVHGYQVEIDPSPRAWSGGIYDESRRGWLNNLADNPAAQKAFKQNEWNHYRIVCNGHSIKTWINGVPAADLVDDMTPSGFIALQVHNTKIDEPMEVRWKNIKIHSFDP